MKPDIRARLEDAIDKIEALFEPETYDLYGETRALVLHRAAVNYRTAYTETTAALDVAYDAIVAALDAAEEGKDDR
jgi:hypothetical protein